MAKSARKKPVVQEAGAGDNGNIVDVEHVEVPHTETENQGLTVQVLTIEEQVSRELARFSPADAGIAKLKEQYGGLVINGQEDKAGYKAVKEAWNLVRSTRTGLEKKGKELRADYTVITKAIGKEEDRLVELITPLEEDLYNKWKAIDDEKERAKKEQEEAEQARLMKRVEEIQTLGMTFADGFYQIGGTISVDVASLRGFNDDQYEKLKGAITAKKAELDKIEADRKEQERLENEKREQEAEKLRQDQKKLDDERAEFERQKKELEEAKAETARLKLENRINQLLALGMTKGGRTMDFDNGYLDFSTPIEDVANCSDEAWPTFFKDHQEGIADRNRQRDEYQAQKKAEQEEKDRREKFIAESLTAVGFTYDYNSKLFKWTSTEVDPVEATWNDFTGLDDAAIATKAHQLGDMITAAKQEEKRIQDERQAEQQKQEKLAMSDKERWASEFGSIEKAILAMVPGQFKTKVYQQKSQNLLNNLTNLLKQYK